MAFVDRSNSKVGVFIGSLSKCGADLLFSPFFNGKNCRQTMRRRSCRFIRLFIFPPGCFSGSVDKKKKKTMRGCKTNEWRSQVSPGRRARPRLLAGKLISIRPISLLLAVLPLSSEAALAVSAEAANVPPRTNTTAARFFFLPLYLFMSGVPWFQV